MKKEIIKNSLIDLLILVLATLLAYAFDQSNIRRENILLIYVLAVLLILIISKKAVYGIVSGIFCVVLFNFLFTEPLYSFLIDDPNYIISLAIFLVVAVVISTLTTSLQKQIEISAENTKRIDLLYQVSKKLLLCKGIESIAQLEESILSDYLKREVSIMIGNGNEKFTVGNFLDFTENAPQIDYAIAYNLICGKNMPKFSQCEYVLFPISTKTGIFGVIAVNCAKSSLTNTQKEFVETNIAHAVTALEREQFAEISKNAKVEAENEKFRSTLLRSISHDIKTPLTSLSLGSGFLLDNFETADDAIKKSFLTDINTETERLNEFVDNLLSMTRLDDNKLCIDKKNEIVDEILSEICQRMSKRLLQHNLILRPNDQIMYVYADSKLLMQVLTNLIDNVIKHTPSGSDIELSYYKQDQSIVFEVADNGGGFKQDFADLFQDFASICNTKQDKGRGQGLGLSICKSIVNAHGGTISAFNNGKGATVKFNIPSKE
ncbi:MAG: DUF4118 domain-containing protein [Clostridia bacterium]